MNQDLVHVVFEPERLAYGVMIVVVLRSSFLPAAVFMPHACPRVVVPWRSGACCMFCCDPSVHISPAPAVCMISYGFKNIEFIFFFLCDFLLLL